MSDVQIRRAAPDDWRLVREVRLATLRTDPAAFGSTADDEAGRPEQDWRHRVEAFTWFLALDEAVDEAAGEAGGRPVGVVRTGTEDGAADGERMLASLWVAPGHRGTGLVGRLVDAVAADARAAGARWVTLWVMRSNARARAAYARLGFVPVPTPAAQAGHECAGEVRLGLRLTPSADVVVRTIASADEWEVLRDVRLDALRTDPGAFYATYAAEAADDEARWRERAARGSMRVAVDAGSGDVLGCLGAFDEEGAPPGGLHLYGMWVAPSARGRGVARVLVDTVCAQARRDGLERVTLWVVLTNTHARAVYAGLGFVEEEPPPGVHDYRPEGEARLVRHLDAAATG
jgi:ribosomal protein S18 acetylase RimI-like enzyme